MAATKSSFTGSEARRLVRKRSKGALSTLNKVGGGPYVSLVNLATTGEGNPIILVSTLAWHTQNLLENNQGSLLVEDTDGLVDPLTGARVTVMGTFQKTEYPGVRQRYLARHPSAQLYVDFGDFSFWTLQIENAHAVAGFGRIETLDAAEIINPAEILEGGLETERDIVDHMNDDHSDVVELYATKLLGLEGDGWSLVSIDADGTDLSDGERVYRLPFDRPVRTADQARATLIQLVKAARS